MGPGGGRVAMSGGGGGKALGGGRSGMRAVQLM